MEQRLTKKDNGKWEMEHGMLLNEFVSSGLDQQRAGDVHWSTTTTTTARAALTALLVADGGSQAQEGEMLNDMKLAIEHDGMNKNKFATQMEELRRAADQETTNHNAAETKITSLTDNLHNLEQKLKAVEKDKAKLTSEMRQGLSACQGLRAC